MIKTNYNLKDISTFKVGGSAEYYQEISTKEELINAVKFAKENSLKITTLGSISNVIIADEGIKGLVIRLKNNTIEKLENNKIKASSGIIWDDLVKYCVEEDLYGMENLSHIPGTVGASAVQNIGAYGQEVSNTIETIIAFDLTTNQFVEISNQEAEFSYRKSIFNTSHANQYIIFEIIFKLNQSREFNLGYKDLAYFRKDKALSLSKIRQEIIKIRQNKLPDYHELPNVGSFFKNITVCKPEFVELIIKARELDKDKATKLQSFANEDDCFKIPTALLIDLCGLKGYKQEHISIYEKHALIVVNHSHKGTSQDILNFSSYISNTIHEKLGVTVEREPTIIN
jgi:UDP-N-acetylmuramate dehydrogenase